jgi:hypothetical protein
MKSSSYDKAFLFLISIFLSLEMITSGNRIYIAIFLITIGSGLWYYRKYKAMLLALLMAPIIAFGASTWANIRSGLGDIGTSLSSYEEHAGSVNNRAVTALVDSTEGGNVMILMHIIKDFGVDHEFFYGQTYAKVLTFFIPRSIYPDKPENFAVQTARFYEPDAETSLTSTALGELYANFGLACLVLFPLLTWMILQLGSSKGMSEGRHALVSMILFSMMISFARSSFSDNVLTLAFALLIVKVFGLEKNLLRSATHSKV